jgi:hypothetical protein
MGFMLLAETFKVALSDVYTPEDDTHESGTY